MDIVGNLPPEINEIILKFLSGYDLWSCLSVNRGWRIQANTNRIWVIHCKDFGIDTCDLCEDDSSLTCEFSLCALASKWMRCRNTIVKWKKKKFKSEELPSLSGPQFYSSNDKLVIIDDTQVVTVISFHDDYCTSLKFSLPSGIEFPDEGNVLINGDHIVIICNNIGIIYKKDKCYNLHSVFTQTEFLNLQISTNNFSQFVKSFESTYLLCKYSFLFHNKFWASYQAKYVCKHHILLDLVTNEITVIKPPLETEVLEVIGVNHRIILESLYEVIIYDIDGTILFKKYVGEFCCVSANDEVVAIFKPSFILIFNILTGSKLSHLLNNFYKPELFVFPNKYVILLTRREIEHDTIYAFSVCTGKQLWSFRVPIPYSQYTEKTFIGIYGTLLVLRVDTDNKYKNSFSIIYVLNIESGSLANEESYTDLLFLSKNCFVKGLNPVKLFLV